MATLDAASSSARSFCASGPQYEQNAKGGERGQADPIHEILRHANARQPPPRDGNQEQARQPITSETVSPLQAAVRLTKLHAKEISAPVWRRFAWIGHLLTFREVCATKLKTLLEHQGCKPGRLLSICLILSGGGKVGRAIDP
jgi:hypothetical protein